MIKIDLCIKSVLWSHISCIYIRYNYDLDQIYSVLQCMKRMGTVALNRPPSRRISAKFAEKTSLAENPPEKNAASRKSAE